MAYRFLRACTKIRLTACDDGHTFRSTSRLQALHGETPGSLRNKAMVLGTRGARLNLLVSKGHVKIFNISKGTSLCPDGFRSCPSVRSQTRAM